MSEPRTVTRTVTRDEVEVLTRMRRDLDRFDAFRSTDVRILLDIIDRLDRSVWLLTSRASASTETDR